MRIVEPVINRRCAWRGPHRGNAMKAIVRMAALVALVCSPALVFAKVQGTGLAIADATLAHTKVERLHRAEDAAHRVASRRVDKAEGAPQQG